MRDSPNETGRRPGGPFGTAQPSPVFSSQAAFRAAMLALAEPGTIQTMAAPAKSVPGLSPAMSALALALLDFETSVWLDPSAPKDAANYLRFHTGTKLTERPDQAAFALIIAPRTMPRLETFALGSLEYPDTSTTLLIDVETLDAGGGWTLSGPGIPGQRRLAAGPLPASFEADMVRNHGRFPCGVDIVFCHGTRIAALPRSTRVTTESGG